MKPADCSAAPTPLRLVLPALRPNGGVREALRLGQDARALGATVYSLCLWRAAGSDSLLADWGAPPGGRWLHQDLSIWPPQRTSAAWQWPLLTGRARAALRRHAAPPGPVVFTHYSTFAAAAAVPTGQRWFLVQDLEWRFAPTLLQAPLRRWMLGHWRQGRLLAANAGLAQELTRDAGLTAQGVLPMWADAPFDQVDAPAPQDRPADVLLVLRRGAHKALADHAPLAQALRAQGLSVWAITPDPALAQDWAGRVDRLLLAPDPGLLRQAYASCRLLLHLSTHEGFGLPPLEAMGAGCVPLCRDSGGIRAYLNEPTLLRPTHTPAPELAAAAVALLADPGRLAALSAWAQEQFRQGLTLHTAARRQQVLWNSGLLRPGT